MNDTFKIGKIVNTHGIKGEVKVYPYTDNLDQFKEQKTLLVSGKKMNVESVRIHKNMVIIKFEEIHTMNDAELLKQKYVEIMRKDEKTLPENTYYISDIKECYVYDEDSNNLGKVFDVIKTRNNDVYWIKEPKELLIPVLNDIVLDVDIKNKKILIANVRSWQDED
ncbi:ribosome maturation factor RimM [Clostridium sp. BJN0001]|uniref:ribosome maturation factor RimM n=1 Tax=Clostridium sp. BJN0001 TaxID=2930219 RepID=UPI001FD3F369|nr:ribosome maturation factor RimM [Clostridium sp. BJN0001]